MTWISLADHTDRRFGLRGLGVDKRETPVLPNTADHLMVRGSIIFETNLSSEGLPQILLGYRVADPMHRSLTFQSTSDGSILMKQVQGKHETEALVPHQHGERADILRITYSWDCMRNTGRLTLEHPENAGVTSVSVDTPMPMPLGDLRDMMMGRGDQVFAAEVVFAALSDEVEPIGPTPSLCSTTLIATPMGYKPIASLQRGDTVISQSRAIVPVLQTVSRVVPARGSFQPLRLRAPYFGLQTDAMVAPDQRLLVDGPEVEYMFSQEAVLMPARHLLNGFAALPEPVGATVRYTQVILPAHDIMIAAGTQTESLHIGRLRRKPEMLAASVLAGIDRSSLPEHGRTAYPVLKWYESVTLAKRRAA